MSVRGMQVGSAAMAAAALLAACSGQSESQPQTAAPVSPPASLTPSRATPTPAPTTSSADPVRAPDDVVLDYYEAVERAYKTLDTTELERLVTNDCDGCRGQIEGIRDIRKKSQNVDGGEYEVQPISRRSDGTTGSVELRLRFLGGKIRTRDGRVVETVPSATDRQQVELRRIDGAWRVAGIYKIA